jgi:hypothetical protein
MNKPDPEGLLIEVQRLARKYGKSAILELADSLESDESRGELVKALRAVASIPPPRRSTPRRPRERSIGMKREVADDPQRSVEAWSRLIAGSGRAELPLEERPIPVRARVTFDRGGRIVGTSSEIPKHLSGLIPVELEIVGSGSRPEHRVVHIEAQDFLRLVSHRAPLASFADVAKE